MQPILILLYVYVFIVGSCIGSFLNVVIYRVPLQITVVKGRSFCPNCHKTLKPYDMIPVFSWFLLGGKCRFCKEPISIRYPIVELLGGLLAILSFYHFGFSWNMPLIFAISMILLVITMIDFDTMTIPNGIIIALIPFIIGLWIMNPSISLLSRGIGFFIISIPMYLLNMVVADSFGGGDIKLIAVCGFMLGISNTLLAMFIAILLAGGYAIYLLVRKKIDQKGHIAFGPYLCIGIYISLLYGNQIMNAYLSIFGI